MEFKTCKKCNQTKELSLFGKNYSRGIIYIRNFCLDCYREAKNAVNRAYMARNRDKQKVWMERHFKTEKYRQTVAKRRAKYRNEMVEHFLKGELKRVNKFDEQTIKNNPELLEFKKAQLTLKRTLRELKED